MNALKPKLRVFSVTLSLLAGLAVITNIAIAEDLDDSLAKVKQLVTEKNYSAALEELGWARKEIEKMNSGQLSSFFPDQLAGFQGGKLESNSAMGFTNIERTYSKSGTSVKVSMTSGSLGGAGGMGGLGSLGQMAAMFGGSAPGQESLRIKGRTAMLEEREGTADLTLFLTSGPIIKLEGTQAATGKILRDLASALPLDEIETYLKGAK